MMFTPFQSWTLIGSLLLLIWLLVTTMRRRARAEAATRLSMTIEDEAANSQRNASTEMMIAEIDAIGEDTIIKLAIEQRRARQQTGHPHIPYDHEVDGL